MDFVFMFWQSCMSIGGSLLHVLPSLLCVFPPSVCDPCALVLGLLRAETPPPRRISRPKKQHLIKTFILFLILLLPGLSPRLTRN